MLALEVEFLTGRYVATSYNDRQVSEWPPHPARLFSALVATWADNEPPSASERAALEWLESAGPPRIRASGCSVRTVMTNYVPVNDTSVLPDLDKHRDRVKKAADGARQREEEMRGVEAAGGDVRLAAAAAKNLIKARKALERETDRYRERSARAIAPGQKVTAQGVKHARELLPAHRIRQPRCFPSVVPDEPTVVFSWEPEPASEIRVALSELARRVVRVGHSSSLVRCAVADCDTVEGDWIPDEEGEEVIRVPLPGQLSRLEMEFSVHREVEPRVLPCRFQRYRHGRKAHGRGVEPRSVLGESWIVFRRVGGPLLHMTRTVEVADGVRGALLSHADDPPSEVLSGHEEGGEPSRRPHVAVIPLPFVGHSHADGRILGVAVVLPRHLPEDSRRAVLRAVGCWEETNRLEDEEAPVVPVRLGRAGVLELERVAWGQPQLSSLRPETWCGPARVWLSATPVALDRNPGNLRARDSARADAAYRQAEKTVAQACINVGLPDPEHVTALPSMTMPGVAKAQQFPPFPATDRGFRRVKVHVRVEFSCAIRGPVVLGAGRYYGLGLLRPVWPGSKDAGHALR